MAVLILTRRMHERIVFTLPDGQAVWAEVSASACSWASVPRRREDRARGVAALQPGGRAACGAPGLDPYREGGQPHQHRRSQPVTETEPLEPWQECWRWPLAPGLSTAALRALAVGLRAADPAIIQRVTVLPLEVSDLLPDPAPTGACPLAYAGWKALGLATRDQLHDFMGKACEAADVRANERGAARHFLRFWDETPLALARPLLLAEVERELALREGFDRAAGVTS